jgi:hypothetical protein
LLLKTPENHPKNLFNHLFCCIFAMYIVLISDDLRAQARGIVAEPPAPLAARVMERIARRERHPQVRREAQARRGSAAKRLAQKTSLRSVLIKN